MIEMPAALFRLAGAQLDGVLDAVVPTVGLLAILMLAVVVIDVVVSVAPVAVPRSRAIGGRSSRHAVLLTLLPASSHPDAAGHARPRAPGLATAVA